MYIKRARLKVISFDIGNTLVNLDDTIGFCTYFCRETNSSPDTIRELLNNYFLKKTTSIEESVREVCSILQIKNYERIISQYVVDKSPVLFRDVVPTLTQLRKDGYKLIACSNCTKWDANDPGNILHTLLDRIFYSFEIGYAKPELDFFYHVQKEIKVEGQFIMHIGDSLNADYYAAKAAGWNAILLNRGNVCIESPARSICSLSELYMML